MYTGVHKKFIYISGTKQNGKFLFKQIQFGTNK